jgi:hypothetical protein
VDTLIFSQSAIFRLQQLGSQYFHHTGVRYRLADPQSVAELLRATALSHQSDVRSCYDAFVMELNKRQIDALAARGVQLRRPQQVSGLRQAV